MGKPTYKRCKLIRVDAPDTGQVIEAKYRFDPSTDLVAIYNLAEMQLKYETSLEDPNGTLVKQYGDCQDQIIRELDRRKYEYEVTLEGFLVEEMEPFWNPWGPSAS